MTKLVFTHSGWTVCTSSWTVASAKPGQRATICYTWASEPGAAKTQLAISVDEFISMIDGKDLVDLRSCQ
jgi:hypothetical protein